MRHEGQRQLTKRAETMTKTEKAQADQCIPWFTNELLSVGPFKASGFTPEETAIIDQRRKEPLEKNGLTSEQVEASGKFGGKRH